MKKIFSFLLLGLCLLFGDPISISAAPVLRLRQTAAAPGRPQTPTDRLAPAPSPAAKPAPGAPAPAPQPAPAPRRVEPAPAPRPVPVPAPRPVPVPAPAPVVEVRMPASPAQVQAIVACLENQSYDERRLEVANLCVMLAPVDVRGLRLIAETFTYDANRLEFLKRSYAACPDKADYMQLRTVLKYRNNVEELLIFIERARR